MLPTCICIDANFPVVFEGPICMADDQDRLPPMPAVTQQMVDEIEEWCGDKEFVGWLPPDDTRFD